MSEASGTPGMSFQREDSERPQILAKQVDFVQLQKKVAEIEAEVERLKGMSTVEMMCENQSVHDHVVEWEGRCLRAEAEVERLKVTADNMASMTAAAADDAEVDQLHESLAIAKGEIERLISVSRYEEKETSEARAEVDRLKGELELMRGTTVRACAQWLRQNRGWTATVEYAATEMESHMTQEEVDGPQQPILGLAPPSSLGPIVVSDFTGALPEQIETHTWEQERAAVIRLLKNQPCEYEGQVPCYSHLLTLIGHIERGEHWPTEGGDHG